MCKMVGSSTVLIAEDVYRSNRCALVSPLVSALKHRRLMHKKIVLTGIVQARPAVTGVLEWRYTLALGSLWVLGLLQRSCVSDY